MMPLLSGVKSESVRLFAFELPGWLSKSSPLSKPVAPIMSQRKVPLGVSRFVRKPRKISSPPDPMPRMMSSRSGPPEIRAARSTLQPVARIVVSTVRLIPTAGTIAVVVAATPGFTV